MSIALKSEDGPTKVPFVPQHPFDNPKADLIIRSSDNVDFPVFKFLLSLSSSFFETMFELPQPSNDTIESKDGLAIIPISESSRIVDKILRFCYPVGVVGKPQIDNIQEAIGLYEAGVKYGMEGLEKAGREALVAREFLEKSPFAVYAVASRYKLEDEAKIAAEATLCKAVVPIDAPELEYISGRDLARLQRYHAKCGEVARALRDDLSWIDGDSTNMSFDRYVTQRRTLGCNCAYSMTRNTIAQSWWWDWLNGTAEALRHKPCGDTVQETYWKALEEASVCVYCRKGVWESLPKTVNRFAAEVSKAVSKVYSAFCYDSIWNSCKQLDLIITGEGGRRGCG
ncbi:hypothetical protein SERLA73DRAFT_101376 [Serpula lacrymans var. lacrymans S7.3]|uniref:BTB domain-containing protein n=2 Tax=Serpula lacrymans var. lacrymans TaxID=341189 RepID=F8PKG2_SERL3|nr:uncharacterized protein SERLADRAFT_359309 [Serpula lacrymans var. lacrymans S7.9]EGO03296.1 hypothetical protein SERLA73DRAFT_101376 [Serpula lacrymans var. lacrymans S7.3]EGO29074.1 hypothetical protein SERLADRAFT_359309 [Serpula lacrymans var. lacrymans S7.9]